MASLVSFNLAFGRTLASTNTDNNYDFVSDLFSILFIQGSKKNLAKRRTLVFLALLTLLVALVDLLWLETKLSAWLKGSLDKLLP